MKTYHIITIGCQMNKSDSERIAGRLGQSGYKSIANKYQADLVVVNTCGVRQMAEDKIYGLIPEIKKANKKCQMILTGCLAGRVDVRKRLEKVVDIWLPIDKIFNSQPVRTRPNRAGRADVQTPIFNFKTNAKCEDDYFKIKPNYQSKFSAFVPIGNGCDNFCSYCVVPYARGREVYRPAHKIAAEVSGLVKRGYKEITLIAQNVNSYRAQKKNKIIDFSDLLKAVNGISGDFWLRFMTSHPKDMSDKLIKIIAGSKKICAQIHLPAQSGDDEVLAAMNRKYTRADYVKLVGKIRKQLNPSRPLLLKGVNWKPPVSITTDIIVGFPGETRKQFNNTAKLMRQVKFDLVYIAKYSVRPGTAAAKLADNVVQAEKKRREQALTKILRKTALANNKKYLGKIVKILVKGKNKRNELFGSTETSKAVKILAGGSGNLAGKFVNVKITAAKDFGLAGEIA